MATLRFTSRPKRTKWTSGPHCWSTALTPTPWHGKASAPSTWQRRRAAWTWCHCCWPRMPTSTCATRYTDLYKHKKGLKAFKNFFSILYPEGDGACVSVSWPSTKTNVFACLCVCVSSSHTQSGLTPLHLAAQEDKVNVAEVLLNHGADVNPQTKVKHTASFIYTYCWLCCVCFYLCFSLYLNFFLNSLRIFMALEKYSLSQTHICLWSSQCYVNKRLIPDWKVFMSL